MGRDMSAPADVAWLRMQIVQLLGGGIGLSNEELVRHLLAMRSERDQHQKRCNELAAQVMQMQAESAWQPIETAPTPASVYEGAPVVLLYDPVHGVVSGRAQRSIGALAWWPTGANIMSDSDDELHPTHWMPLPEGP